ncbi:MAG: hypothetical protein KDA49_10410, partial [Rhodospirillaceae bacterium]|nr:hypothetical protein [Rhodospirillaceae bacterium]
DDYGHQHGPSFVLTPGDYPNIAQNPGFPGDRMSSVRLIVDDQPPPPALPPPEPCPPPYHVQTSDGRCVWSCGPGTQPDPASQQCVCQPGYSEIGQDQFGRRTCSLEPPQQPICPGPYHVQTSDGRCVWSCGSGTQPDPATNQCVCQPGLTEIDQDQFGRRVCGPQEPPPPACPPPYHVQTSDGRCVWSCATGTQPDPASGQCVCQPGRAQIGQDQFGRRVCQ